MNLQNFIKVSNPFDVVCLEKKLAANERPMLEQTTDVVTQPSDVVVSLDVVPLNQTPSVASAPSNTRKRSPQFSTSRSSNKLKGVESSGPGAHVAKESATRDDDSLVLVSSGLPSSADVSKVGEFVPDTKSQLTILPPKSVIGESVAGSSQEATYDARSQQLVSKGDSKVSASHLFASTRSGSLVSSRLGPRSKPMAQHIPRIIFHPVEYSAETHCEDRFYASMSVDPSVAKDIYRSDSELTNDFIMDKEPMCHKIRLRLENAELERSKLERRLGRRNAALEKLEVEVERLNKIVNEKPSGDMARLRLGFEEAKKEALHLKKLVENLKVEANKVSWLMASYAQKETHLATLNAKFQDLL
ncbi:hypothetical protein Tco_1500229 [Tanacetum coccineum]